MLQRGSSAVNPAEKHFILIPGRDEIVTQTG